MTERYARAWVRAAFWGVLAAGAASPAGARPTDEQPEDKMINPKNPACRLDGACQPDARRRHVIAAHVMRVTTRQGASCTATVLSWTPGERVLATAGHCLLVGDEIEPRLWVHRPGAVEEIAVEAGAIDPGYLRCVRDRQSPGDCTRWFRDQALIRLKASDLQGVPGWKACRAELPAPGRALAIYAHGLTGVEWPGPSTGVLGLGAFTLGACDRCADRAAAPEASAASPGTCSPCAVATSLQQGLHFGDSGGPVIDAAEHDRAGTEAPWVMWTVSGFAEGGAPRLGTTALLNALPHPTACRAAVEVVKGGGHEMGGEVIPEGKPAGASDGEAR